MTTGLLFPALLLAQLAAAAGSQSVPAQAQASGTTAPIKLTFSVYKSSIAVGERLWFRVRITNVGKKAVLVHDDIFTDPWKLRDQILGRFGVFLEVLDPRGRPLEFFSPMVDRHPPPQPSGEVPVSGLLEIHGPEEGALVDKWKSEGLKSDEIDRRLMKHNMAKFDAEKLAARPRPRPLQPGEFLETKSWFHHRRMDRSPPPEPIGDFARLEFFKFDKPGTYRIRAVFDHRLSESNRSWLKKRNIPPGLDMMTRTSWIAISVKP